MLLGSGGEGYFCMLSAVNKMLKLDNDKCYQFGVVYFTLIKQDVILCSRMQCNSFIDFKSFQGGGGHTLLFLNSNFEIFKGTVHVISRDLLIKNVEDTVVFFTRKLLIL